MIKSEINNGNTVVRIHDEYFDAIPQDSVSRLTQIVSASYKRRALARHQFQKKEASPSLTDR